MRFRQSRQTTDAALRIDPRHAALAAAPALTPVGPSTRGAGGARFSLEPSRADEAKAARSSAPLATLDAILALQGEEDPGERKRRSARRGQDVLDALDGLKAALLSGRISPAELGQIQARLGAMGASGDPELDAILAAIDLRARVELAKLGRALSA